MTRIVVVVRHGLVARIVADNGEVVDAVVVDMDFEEQEYMAVEEDFHEVTATFERVEV